MVDIKDIEEGVLIETNDFNMSVQNLCNDIMVRGRGMPGEEVRKFASNIIASMVAEGLISLVKTTYVQEDEDLFSPESERELTHEEMDLILKQPEKWEEKEVFSPTEVYEMVITEQGRERLFAD